MRRKILLVDAHDESRDVYRSILQWAGYGVIEATSGVEGVAAATRETVDMIVSELLLPGMDGLRLASVIKGSPETASIPILILTADGEGLESAATRIGCCGYLMKPCTPSRLLTEVRRHVQPAGDAESA